MGWIRRLFRRDKGPISLVMLLSEPDTIVRAKLSAAVVESKEDGPIRWVSLGPLPRRGKANGGDGFGVVTPTGGLGVIICDDPYVPNVGVTADMMPEHLGEPFRRHKAWIGVDWMGKRRRDVDPYSLIGPIARMIMPETCVLLYMPETSHASLPTPTMLDALENENWVEVFDEIGSDHTVQAGAERKALERIAEAARASLPEFVNAFESGDGEDFSIKAPFTDGHSIEHMWVRVESIGDDEFHGELGNESAIAGYRCGQQVSVALDDVEDWIYMKDGEMIGGESAKLLAARRGMM